MRCIVRQTNSQRCKTCFFSSESLEDLLCKSNQQPSCWGNMNYFVVIIRYTVNKCPRLTRVTQTTSSTPSNRSPKTTPPSLTTSWVMSHRFKSTNMVKTHMCRPQFGKKPKVLQSTIYYLLYSLIHLFFSYIFSS